MEPRLALQVPYDTPGPEWNPACRSGSRTGSRIQPCASGKESRAPHNRTGDEHAVKKRMDILEQMEYDRKGPDGGNITLTAAVSAINETAKKMEILYQALTTARSHLSVIDKE